MAVYWDWKNKCGELTMKDPRNGKYTINLYEGDNCMTVLLYEYKDQQTNKDMYQFMGFWNDMKHLQNCILGMKGSTDHENLYKNAVKLKLNTNYLPKEWYKIAKIFTENTPAKVELYYKQPKETKKKQQ